jgi:hypothetical protein
MDPRARDAKAATLDTARGRDTLASMCDKTTLRFTFGRARLANNARSNFRPSVLRRRILKGGLSRVRTLPRQRAVAPWLHDPVTLAGEHPQ